MVNSLQITQPELRINPPNFNRAEDMGSELDMQINKTKVFLQQDELFNRFKQLMEKEAESYEKFTNFIDSKLDIQKINKFNSDMNSGILAKNKWSVFTIDFGGSSLKISTILIDYSDSQNRDSNQNILPRFSTLHEERYLYSSEDLQKIKKMEWNDWVADKVAEYIENNSSTDLVLDSSDITYASLTFSFPMEMKSIDSGFVQFFNKTFYFNEENLMSVDIVKALNTSLENKNIPLRVNCILNDVVASYTTALAFHYENPVAAIVGTGTNGGFVLNCSGKDVIVNSEWARFNIDDVVVDKAYQNVLDKNSRFLKLEALTSGIAFVDIIKEMVRSDPCCTNLSSIVDLPLIKYVFYKEESDNEDVIKKVATLSNDELDRLNQCVLKFKTNAYRLLAPIIVAASQSKKFTLLLNGTVACHESDASLIEQCIKEFLKNKKANVEFSIIRENSASLFGAAFISVVYQN